MPHLLVAFQKINNTLIGNAEDLDIVMPLYNLLEYSKNYCRDEPNDPPADNCNEDPITNPASFRYKNSIIGKMVVNRSTKKVDFAIPLNHLSNFWRISDMPLINCEVSLTWPWSKSCVLTDVITHAVVPAQENVPEIPAIAAPINAAFAIKNCKFYVPVVTLSAENDNKLLDNRTITWNKSHGINIDQKCLIRLKITI